MLDALVCLGCDSPNPPSFTVCRGCGVSLSKGNSGRRTVPQPALGIIYLSGGGREVVDTSLIIGRNPRHGVIEDYQRGVFLGTDDRTVSRRQVELKLEGWRPIVINIAKKAPSTIESQTGEVFILAAGDSRSLNDGDTVRFSTVWFRYHASTTVATKEVTNSGEASGPSDIVPGATLGEVCDEELPRERMVEALVCLGCDSPSPPSSEVCRGCGVNLSEVNSERRMVPQPVVGVIRLSGGGLEVLDTDLIIGRNPTYETIEPHQRPIVHGTNDRSVSRRHIKVLRDGWRVIVINFNKGRGTKVKTTDGEQLILPQGIPHEINDGDSIFFGSVWFQYRIAGASDTNRLAN